MIRAESAVLAGFLTTLMLTASVALAAQIDVSIDKRTVSPGGTITVTGTITSDDGEAGEFTYRVVAVAPGQRHGGEKVIVCDSGRQTTGADGAVSFECNIPTIAELEELGVENAADRSVIPIKGGIVARDSATNETAKKSGKALIINTDKFKEKFEAALERLDAFIGHAQDVIAKCENITARAEESGLTDTVERCGSVQEKMQEKIDDALAAQERIDNAISNIDDLGNFSFDRLKDSLVNFRRGGEDFRVDVRDLRRHVVDVKVDLERRAAREIADIAKDRAQEIRDRLREEQRQLEDRLKDLRDARAERISDAESSSSSGSSDEDVSSGSSSGSGSGSGSDTGDRSGSSESEGGGGAGTETDNFGSGSSGGGGA